MRIPETDYIVIKTIVEGGKLPVEEIVKRTLLDQSYIFGIINKYEKNNWFTIDEDKYTVIKIKKTGRELLKHGFLEKDFIQKASKSLLTAQEFKNILSSYKEKAKEVQIWLFKRKWVKKENNHFLIDKNPKNFTELPEEKLLDYFKEVDEVREEEIKIDKKILNEAFNNLKVRGNALYKKERVIRNIKPSEQLLQIFPTLIPVKEVSVLTPELISTGEWKNVILKKYNIHIDVEKTFPGKSHPLKRVIERTRKVFLEMGFHEINSPYVETGFWDFDALFQPQDHPAREMQDTFYLKKPLEGKLPEEKILNAVKETHENGGDTLSRGWGYKWSRDISKKTLLRTHTTAATIRYLSKNPYPPARVFTVGRVFRREKITYKHLPEFHQVDGIVIDKDANFSSLLALLKVFYNKMGFREIRFRPAFFPYTEPSLEVYVKFADKGWIELGGAGIFRPEVYKPLGCNVPVLAWGLGLERLAMLIYSLKDIRSLYFSDINWLKGVPTCL